MTLTLTGKWPSGGTGRRSSKLYRLGRNTQTFSANFLMGANDQFVRREREAFNCCQNNTKTVQYSAQQRSVHEIEKSWEQYWAGERPPQWLMKAPKMEPPAALWNGVVAGRGQGRPRTTPCVSDRHPLRAIPFRSNCEAIGIQPHPPPKTQITPMVEAPTANSPCLFVCLAWQGMGGSSRIAAKR